MSSFTFSSLLDSLADKRAKFQIEKQAVNDLIYNATRNKFQGKEFFDAVVLSGAPANNQPINEGEMDRLIALKVRPLDIHNFALPDPCNVQCVSEKQRLMALHPTAYQVIGAVSTDAIPEFGSVVECYWQDGPARGGRMRGLRWRIKVGSQVGFYDFKCDDLSSLVSDFTYNQLLGDQVTYIDFNRNEYKGEEYPNAVEFMKILKNSGHFGAASDAFFAALAANAEAESSLGRAKNDPKLNWVVGDKVGVSDGSERTNRSINGWCSHGYWQMNVCPPRAEGSLFAEKIGADMTTEEGKKKFVKAVNNHAVLFPWLSTRLNEISKIDRLRTSSIAPHRDTAGSAEELGDAICRYWEKPASADTSAKRRGARAVEIFEQYRAQVSSGQPLSERATEAAAMVESDASTDSATVSSAPTTAPSFLMSIFNKIKVINPDDVASVSLSPPPSLDATATPTEVKNLIKTNEVPNSTFCGKLDESAPRFEYAPCETAFLQNDNNAFVVLGRDRPASLASGYGGQGATGAGMIDLVAGRLSSTRSVIGFKRRDKKTLTGNNFAADAARVYISQMANIDEYFGLPDAKPFQIMSSTARSAVGAKADHVRIIGRNDVKIYAGRMKGWTGFANSFGGINRGEPNSQGGQIDNTQCHIYLMGGGSEQVQPLVRGENLKEYLLLKEEQNREQDEVVVNILLQLIALSSALVPVLGPAAVENIKSNFEDIINKIFKNINSEIQKIQAFGLNLGPTTLTNDEKCILSKNVFTS